jgi:hypothetical protein
MADWLKTGNLLGAARAELIFLPRPDIPAESSFAVST